jgi:pimeloyl-ACP methyl ester carboxylesterase
MLHFIERGNIAGPTVVFIHGWPDTDRVFDKQYDALKGTYRLICLQLPNFAKKATDFPAYAGFTIDELADRVIATTTSAMKGRTEKPALVVHDWGASIGYATLRKQPTMFRKLVALDIGQHVGKLPVFGGLIVLWYQWSLILGYVLPSFLGSLVTKFVATVFKAPNAANAHSGMNYLYLQIWKLILTGKLKGMTGFNPPTIPTLYMYGAKKPFYFHSQRFVDHIKGMPGSAVLPFNADHWFFLRPQCVEPVNQAILKFLAA